MAICCGRYGLSPEQFWNMEPAEVTLFMREAAKKAEQEELNEWRQIRWLAAVTVNPHVKKRITPRELLPLPGDRKTSDAPPPSKAQIRKLDAFDEKYGVPTVERLRKKEAKVRKGLIKPKM